MRYFWLVIFVLSVGSVSAQNSARVRELEKQRKAALAEIEMTSQLLDETRQTARNSLNRLNLLSKQILSRKQVISLLNQEIGEIDKQHQIQRLYHIEVPNRNVWHHHLQNNQSSNLLP